MDKLKKLLKKSPTLYDAASKTRYNARYLKVRVLGTSVKEKQWATRHLRDGKDLLGPAEGEEDWVGSYWKSKDHPHRILLVETIAQYKPNSVLEVGSNCGPNVYLLAKKFPNAKIVGVDINPLAVERGNDLLRREGFSNAKLICTKADELAQFENKSFDVVFTDAVLIYIGPDKIMNTIKEFTRLAKKGLVFVEWQSPKPDSGLGEYFNGNWIRDYTTLLSNFASKEKIQVRKLLREDWPDERWSTIGAIINCEL